MPERAIGDDTLTCMQSGCVLGSALLLDGLIDRMEAELGRKATVVATGGIAPVIAPPAGMRCTWPQTSFCGDWPCCMSRITKRGSSIPLNGNIFLIKR